MSRIKKFNELTRELQETIARAKEKFLNTIIEDNTISKIEKLQLISDNDLFGTKGWIQDLFTEYEEEFKVKLGGRAMLDDWFHFQEFERHRMVNLAEIFEYFNEDDDDMITILKDRYTGKTFKISKYEFIDTVYDWCIKNKCIGFQWDW